MATLGRDHSYPRSLVGGRVSSEPQVPVPRFLCHPPSPRPQSTLLAQNGTSSLPRNLAATLQDIETKRQLALQQKGEWPPHQSTCCPRAPGHPPHPVTPAYPRPHPSQDMFPLHGEQKGSGLET